jgi:two-component system OmpR family sensor kinase
VTIVSLRGRLLFATVVLVALGLLVADTATYGLLRSSLIGRVDDQLRGASRFVGRVSFDGGGGGGGPRPGPGDSHHEDYGGAQPQTQVVERLDAAGAVLYTSGGPLGLTQSPPTLPSGLPGSSASPAGGKRLFTTGSADGTVRYRVLAQAVTDGGTVVLAFPLGDAENALHKLLLIEAIVTAAVLAAVAGIALWLVKLGLRPLTQMEHAAADIAAGDLSRRVQPSEGRTEIGRLGRALNAMMERIEAAFAERRASEARLRRFVADASHELRTPLTSIRGYAELFRRGAQDRPEDLAKSMRRIEEESARMGTLVDELLLLARLDQGPVLDRAAVDLSVVAADAVSDASTVAQDRPIDLSAPNPVIVDGDDARLRQVAANLLSNALEHTPAATPVRVRVSASNGEATLEVADEGPGLSSDDASRVFDRFFRVDEGRSRDDGGAGLGLSIVAAIAHAHGGRVEVLTAPGEGARFIVTLPLSGSSYEKGVP